MSLTLVLNAAEARLQIVLAEDGRLLAAEDWYAPSNGTELLPPMLDTALRRLGRTPADIGRMACVTGPGSFTGIRLVLTLAAALRRGLDIPCAGLNYMQALAASLPCAEGTRIHVLTAARRDKVHAQTFIMTATGLPLPHPVTPVPLLLPLAEAAGPQGAVCIGSGADKAPPPPEGTVHARLVAPSPEALLLLAEQAATWERRDLDPLYVRPCDAIDNLDHIAALRGQNPADAHVELERLLRSGVALR